MWPFRRKPTPDTRAARAVERLKDAFGRRITAATHQAGGISSSEACAMIFATHSAGALAASILRDSWRFSVSQGKVDSSPLPSERIPTDPNKLAGAYLSMICGSFYFLNRLMNNRPELMTAIGTSFEDLAIKFSTIMELDEAMIPAYSAGLDSSLAENSSGDPLAAGLAIIDLFLNNLDLGEFMPDNPIDQMSLVSMHTAAMTGGTKILRSAVGLGDV